MALKTLPNPANDRCARMLRTALGPHLGALLADDTVVELMLNPDGRIWVDRLKSGMSDTGASLAPEDGERIIRLVAHHVGVEAHALSPRLSAELPETRNGSKGYYHPRSSIRPLRSVSPLRLSLRSISSNGRRHDFHQI